MCKEASWDTVSDKCGPFKGPQGRTLSLIPQLPLGLLSAFQHFHKEAWTRLLISSCRLSWSFCCINDIKMRVENQIPYIRNKHFMEQLFSSSVGVLSRKSGCKVCRKGGEAYRGVIDCFKHVRSKTTLWFALFLHDLWSNYSKINSVSPRGNKCSVLMSFVCAVKITAVEAARSTSSRTRGCSGVKHSRQKGSEGTKAQLDRALISATSISSFLLNVCMSTRTSDGSFGVCILHLKGCLMFHSLLECVMAFLSQWQLDRYDIIHQNSVRRR